MIKLLCYIATILTAISALYAEETNKKTAKKIPNAKQRAFKLYEPSEFNGMPYRLMKPVDFDPEKTYPLILSLHGKGGEGTNNRRSVKVWNRYLAEEKVRRKHPCFVLVPQTDSGWRVNGSEGIGTKEDIESLSFTWNKYKERLSRLKPINNGNLSLAFDLIEKLKTEYKIDNTRIYVLGHSLGGFGSWSAIWHRPDYFAAAIPCAGGLVPWKTYSKIKDVPIWAFHSADDPIVSVEYTRAIFAALKKAGGNMKYTEFDGYGHGSQVHAFAYKGDAASGFTTQYAGKRCDKTQDVWDWLFKQKKKAVSKKIADNKIGPQQSPDPYPWAHPAKPADLEIIIVGDINIQNRDNPAGALANVRATLSNADLRYANLEGLYGQTEKTPIARKAEWRHSDPAMIEALTAGGFDVVGCANNVCYGEEAILNTLKLLDENNILHCGAGASRTAARAPAIIERCGTRVGFLQYTARYYGEEQIATENSAGVARLNHKFPSDIEALIADVKALRDKVDVVIVSHHLRKSRSTKTENYQRQVARAMVAAGADLVFGHGGHVIQGIEMVDSTPVVHCIGNFAFDWWKMKDRNDGLLMRLIVRDRKIIRLSIVPVCRDDNNNVYLTGPASKEGARQIEALRKSSPTVPLCVEGREVVVPLN